MNDSTTGGRSVTASPAQAQQTQLAQSWISYRDAQRISGLGRTTLWKLVSSSQIKAARVGRAVRINRCSLEEYMERHSITNVEN